MVGPQSPEASCVAYSPSLSRTPTIWEDIMRCFVMLLMMISPSFFAQAFQVRSNTVHVPAAPLRSGAVRLAASPELKQLVVLVMTDHETITCPMVMDVVEKSYRVRSVPFSVGDVSSAAGENMGSAKILSLGQMLSLSKEVTLWLFGDYYREDVLKNPEGTDHANIRAFMKVGWSGVSFPEGLALEDKNDPIDV